VEVVCGLSGGNVFAQSVSAGSHVGLGVAFPDVGELVTVLSEQAMPSTLVPGVLVPIV
jgi:hypothetical protein